jgi:hypothetical protein
MGQVWKGSYNPAAVGWSTQCGFGFAHFAVLPDGCRARIRCNHPSLKGAKSDKSGAIEFWRDEGIANAKSRAAGVSDAGANQGTVRGVQDGQAGSNRGSPAQETGSRGNGRPPRGCNASTSRERRIARSRRSCRTVDRFTKSKVVEPLCGRISGRFCAQWARFGPLRC